MTKAKPPETWTAEQCAEHWGIGVTTWRDYVRKSGLPGATLGTPQPLPGYDDDRKKRWLADAVRSWSRPGSGNRGPRRGHRARSVDNTLP